MVKRGLDFFYFEIEQAPSELLLTGQANSAFIGRCFCTGQKQFKNGSFKSRL